VNDDERVLMGHLIKLAFGAALFAFMVLWLWIAEYHATTRALDQTSARLIEQHVVSLPYAEKELVRDSLSQCFHNESRRFHIPFKPETVAVYGLFGDKSLPDTRVQQIAEGVIEDCAFEFVREPASITEMRARMELLRQAGFEVDALGGTS